MVDAQPNICPEKWDSQTPLRFWYTNGSSNLGQTTRPHNNQQKMRIFRIVRFAVTTDNRVKVKESEKKDKYIDAAGDWKNCGTWKWRLCQL